MSPCLEFEDKSVEKAVGKACKELDTTKEKLKYDVISYGSTGIFGLVAVKKAKIRVIADKKEVCEPEHKNREKADPKKETNDVREIPAVDSAPPLADESEKEKPGKYPEETIELGRDALQRIIDFITTDAEIFIKEGAERLSFDVRGGNSAVLIGKRGQTLEAIQYLLEKVINKKSEKRVRIQVDIEGYLENRRSRLRGLASRMAEKAKKSGKPVTIDQLNSHDRRIIHLALKNENNVRTQSMGDGPYRKLVIFPKKHSKRKRPAKVSQ